MGSRLPAFNLLAFIKSLEHHTVSMGYAILSLLTNRVCDINGDNRFRLC
jgi:hypothetical protein